MDRLKPLDALFVDAEDQDKNTSMAIASIAVFEGPPPSHEEVLALVADRLPLMPRYRQKLRTVPFRKAPAATRKAPAKSRGGRGGKDSAKGDR